MKPPVDFERLCPIADMVGEDEQETAELQDMLRTARKYLAAYPWCRSIRNAYFGFGGGGVVAVFLFEIVPASNADPFLWVVTGDLPTAYLVPDHARTPESALTVYCAMMEEWIAAVRSGKGLELAYPVEVPPTKENAKELEIRTTLLRGTIIPSIGRG